MLLAENSFKLARSHGGGAKGQELSIILLMGYEPVTPAGLKIKVSSLLATLIKNYDLEYPFLRVFLVVRIEDKG
jgi:hypothetical protein